MESDWKGRETGWDLCPWKGPQKRGLQGKDPPWRESGCSLMLGTPAWGSDTRKMSPVHWLEKLD